MKGHPLFWHEFVPHWLPTTTQELKRLLVKRFREISERYADVIGSFDVVNEPSRIFDCNQRKEDRFYHLALEEDYCKWIFDLANRYFPANRLFLNDTVGAAFFDYRGEYSAYYQHIKNLLNEGVRIDAIGMQCHLCPAAGFENVFDQKRLLSRAGHLRPPEPPDPHLRDLHGQSVGGRGGSRSCRPSWPRACTACASATKACRALCGGTCRTTAS